MSRVLSRVIICLGRLSPAASSDQPEAGGPRHRFCSVLLRMGFTEPPLLPGERWSLTPPFHPCRPKPAVSFCCTFLGVASTGRYPASCPVKPGLSSSAPFRLYSRDHLSWLRKCYSSMVSPPSKAVFQTSKQLPPTNSLSMELWGTSSLGTATK